MADVAGSLFWRDVCEYEQVEITGKMFNQTLLDLDLIFNETKILERRLF